MTWSALHRVIGLALGAWLSLVGLSGAVLVFHQEFDQWANADLLTVDAVPERPDFDCMVQALGARYPDRTVLFFDRPGLQPNESAPFGVSHVGANPLDIRNAEAAAELEVFVDPATCTVLGDRPYHSVMRWIRSFHMELLVPGAGQRTLGAIGVVVLVTVIAGVVLWWRQLKKPYGRAFKVKISAPTPRLVRDLHTAPGIYVALFLMIQVVSGVLVCDWLQIRAFAIRMFDLAPTFSARMIETDAPPVPVVTMNTARDAAMELYPNSIVSWMGLPLTPEGRYSVRLYPTDMSKARHTRQVEINAQTGHAFMRFDPDLLPWPQALMNLWMIWIHNGHFFGLPGRVIVLLTGVVLTFLFPTGLYIWLRQRKSRLARLKRAQ